MRRRLAFAVMCALALVFVTATAGTRPASAQNDAIQELIQLKVNLSAHNLPLRQTLTLLFFGKKAPLHVDPNVPDPKITVSLENRPFFEVMSQVVRLASTDKARLQFGIGREMIYVIPNPNTPEEEKRSLGAQRKVFLSLKDVPIQRAFDLVFAGSGLQYSIAPTVPNLPVTLDLNKVSIEQALPLLVESLSKRVNLAVTLERDVYSIRVVK